MRIPPCVCPLHRLADVMTHTQRNCGCPLFGVDVNIMCVVLHFVLSTLGPFLVCSFWTACFLPIYMYDSIDTNLSYSKIRPLSNRTLYLNMRAKYIHCDLHNTDRQACRGVWHTRKSMIHRSKMRSHHAINRNFDKLRPSTKLSKLFRMDSRPREKPSREINNFKNT